MICYPSFREIAADAGAYASFERTHAMLHRLTVTLFIALQAMSTIGHAAIESLRLDEYVTADKKALLNKTMRISGVLKRIDTDFMRITPPRGKAPQHERYLRIVLGTENNDKSPEADRIYVRKSVENKELLGKINVGDTIGVEGMVNYYDLSSGSRIYWLDAGTLFIPKSVQGRESVSAASWNTDVIIVKDNPSFLIKENMHKTFRLQVTYDGESRWVGLRHGRFKPTPEKYLLLKVQERKLPSSHFREIYSDSERSVSMCPIYLRKYPGNREVLNKIKIGDTIILEGNFETWGDKKNHFCFHAIEIHIVSEREIKK